MPGRNYATAERTTIAKHNSAFMHRELRLRLRELTSSSMRWLAKRVRCARMMFTMRTATVP